VVSYDAPYPEPLSSVRPLDDAFAVALVMSAGAEKRTGPLIRVESSDHPATPMQDSALEALRRGVPAARCLPLLALLAREEDGEVAIDYLDGMSLRIQVRR
jgi:hypothetical protein